MEDFSGIKLLWKLQGTLQISQVDKKLKRRELYTGWLGGRET